mgnify:CR=1 FL=1
MQARIERISTPAPLEAVLSYDEKPGIQVLERIHELAAVKAALHVERLCGDILLCFLNIMFKCLEMIELVNNCYF